MRRLRPLTVCRVVLRALASSLSDAVGCSAAALSSLPLDLPDLPTPAHDPLNLLSGRLSLLTAGQVLLNAGQVLSRCEVAYAAQW